jgi:hypothetical protein
MSLVLSGSGVVTGLDSLASSDLGAQLGSKLPIAGGKILQIVRATDSTQRSTTSTSFVDVTGMSVTITPQKDNSAIILIAAFSLAISGGYARTQITDSSNNAISGAQTMLFGPTANLQAPHTLIGYATPAITSPVTYKLRFLAGSTFSVFIENGQSTGQLYAIEVSA